MQDLLTLIHLKRRPLDVELKNIDNVAKKSFEDLLLQKDGSRSEGDVEQKLRPLAQEEEISTFSEKKPKGNALQEDEEMRSDESSEESMNESK